MFGDAIKMAALARERRLQEEAAKPKAPPPPQAKPTSYASPATPPQSNIPPPPPGAPPPPPIMPPPEQATRISPAPGRRSPPPHVKKQLEETKKREDSHNQLMQAVLKRRNMVENQDQTRLADNIEKRFNKDRRLQTTVYKSDQTKEDVPNAPSPGALLASTPKSEPMRAEPKPISPQSNGRVETSRPPVAKKSPPPPPPPAPAVKPPTNRDTPNGTAEAAKRDSVGNGSTDFLAMAEKARQDYLQKKGLSTLERKKKEQQDEEASLKKRDAPKPPEPKNDHPRAPRSAPPSNDNSGTSNFANLVAQRAMEREKKFDGVERNNNIKPESGSQKVYKANVPAGGGGTRLSNDPVSPGKSPAKSTDWSERTVEIKGATIDYSQTETPRASRAASFTNEAENISVSDRKRLFENGQLKAGNKFVFPAKQDGSSMGDAPPPMIPPPSDFSSNGHPVNGNGHIPNNRSSPMGGGHKPTDSSPFHSRDSAIQSKLSQANRGRLVPDSVHSNGVATMVMVPEPEVADPMVDIAAIPPPPLFSEYQNLSGAPGVHDDAVSMVSSVSTLSTLSSADHGENYDSPYHSRAANGPEIPTGVPPPPPPGFDDSPSNDTVGYAEFIPPPMEFEPTISLSGPGGDAPTSLRSVMRPGSSSHYPAKPSTKPFLSKPIESWSIADVGDWLDGLQLGEHRDKFSMKNINGQKLMQMGRAELIALGVTQVGHRMNIERAIKKALMNK